MHVLEFVASSSLAESADVIKLLLKKYAHRKIAKPRFWYMQSWAAITLM